jgi:hypothetical protein
MTRRDCVRAPYGSVGVKAEARAMRGGHVEHKCTEPYRMDTCRGCGEVFWVCPFCDRYGEVRYCLWRRPR